MKLEEAIENTKKRIKSWESIAEIGKHTLCKEEYENSQNICEEQKILIEEIEHLQKENEELKEHNRKYLEAEIFSAKQLKEIEKQRKEHYIDKGTLANIISRKRIYIPEYMGEFIARDDIENLLG